MDSSSKTKHRKATNTLARSAKPRTEPYRLDTLVIEDLRMFQRMAEVGSLSAVAREREIPVSRVSRSLARVEAKARLRLVQRSTQAISLTPEGELFLAYCRDVLGATENLESELVLNAGSAAGLVRVAASTVIAQYLLVPSLPAFHAKHPDLRIELSATDSQLDLVKHGVDLAIRATPRPPESMVAKQIGLLSRALYCAPSYAKRHGLPSTPSELKQHMHIGNSTAVDLNQWSFYRSGRKDDVSVTGFWRANDSGVVMSMVLAGLGIGRLGMLAAEPFVRDGKLIRALPEYDDGERVPLFAIYPSSRRSSPKISACIEFWSETARVAWH